MSAATATAESVDPARLDRWHARLQSLPSIALPTDYPRPSSSQLVQALTSSKLSTKVRNALVRLTLHHALEAHNGEEETSDDEDDDEASDASTPTPFHLLLAAFTVLLHRYTGDTDLIIGSSSPIDGKPLILRIPIEAADPFWQIVRRVQSVEAEAAADNAPYEDIVARLEADKAGAAGGGANAMPSAPIFRVRFFDETGGRQRSFLQSTSLTTDLTLFVTRPGEEESLSMSGSTATLQPGAEGAAAARPTLPSTPSFRQPVVPAIALHASYNALLFSSSRMSTLLAHLSHVVLAAASDPLLRVGSIALRTQAEDAVLPDPRKDLDFCGFQGAITSIFERNAAAHPQRRAIIESLPGPADALDLPAPASLTREITYGALDRASNVLAHHLLAHGLQREDVVTIYAHRSADLVVAIMGTLKAGGTFSVIDPAYPPSRQNIYLQVAKPRALVVLKKAGTLHPSVRKCIEEELQLRVEVPALELVEEGAKGELGVRGGAASEGAAADVFIEAQKLAGKSTNLVLGPDSVGTLSFTSGSTGIPKGVKGRHHSLTHFFPWMGERFGLDAQSRFTMLSGIAHDPIQRDIFTPLFFGAELHVPTAEDIGTPGRLAEWMAASQATVTHLTPAMGQLLSAQAVAPIPQLKNAFFVGDVLTKRDCTRLQALARNVRIINMYGTTETQRAVSYFAIPPVSEKPTFLTTQKDIMPAGQGMIDVQLLVVNRHERTATCAVGEVGEIYVRSGGLAEGYLGPAEVTAEKFLPNFLAPDASFADTLAGTEVGAYWHGVRDRMYRTGDLGRYLPDGTVECTGRADDQVKIRGFRIELGEIDTHLSRHAHVRENVTLVRRDKDEEKVLVSYFVPGPGAAQLEEGSSAEEGADAAATAPRDTTSAAGLVRGMRRHRRLIKDIREHLKKKLPAYSIPTLFVPLARLPLNPNGKIDKPALPFPDTALASAAMSAGARATTAADGAAGGGAAQGGDATGASKSSSSNAQRPLTPTEATIVALFSTLLPSCPQPISPSESFFDLGGHSILATRLVFSMRKTFVVNVPLGVVFDHPSAEGLARQVDRLRDNDLHLGAPLPGAAEQAAAAPVATAVAPEDDYAADVDVLLRSLPESFVGAGTLSNIGRTSNDAQRQTILLTGATGFLGAFVLRDLLTLRSANVARVIAHVRARDVQQGLARLREGGLGRGAWDEEWVTSGRLSVVVGDLAEERLGLKKDEWIQLAHDVDAIVHNGALVHWVYPYTKLRAANVLSTVAAIMLCATGKPKTFTFVSSTSALDTDHYVHLSDSIAHGAVGTSSARALAGVPETDDLAGSARGLGTGYGQSKWVSERLVMACAARGLRACIVRPGYVVGDSQSAVTNTDDFLWRLVKGSTQLGLVPDMHNAINMVPVDHVARVTALAALAAHREEGNVSGTAARVYHVTAHPLIRFNDLLSALARHGWETRKADYVQWRAQLEEHVLKSTPKEGEKDAQESNALFPLLHFVLDDLPTSTKSPELDDAHTQALLDAAQEGAASGTVMGVDDDLVAVYLAWLVAVGFLPKPSIAPGQPMIEGEEVVQALPVLKDDAARKAIGRGSAN